MMPPPTSCSAICLAPWLDLAGLAVFAASGALAAARRGQTIVTLSLLRAGHRRRRGHGARSADRGAGVLGARRARGGGVPGRRGGDLGDAGALVARRARSTGSTRSGSPPMRCIGAAKALGYGVPPVPAALMGVVTACVGGIIRDVLAGEPSILMRPELYVTAAALAAGLLRRAGAGWACRSLAGGGDRRGGRVRAARGGDAVAAGAARLSWASVTSGVIASAWAAAASRLGQSRCHRPTSIQRPSL